jgi:predicted nucleic acid-binding protein
LSRDRPPKRILDAIKRCGLDNRILECAPDVKADVLISGDMKDLRPLGVFQGASILTPREFLIKRT